MGFIATFLSILMRSNSLCKRERERDRKVQVLGETTSFMALITTSHIPTLQPPLICPISHVCTFSIERDNQMGFARASRIMMNRDFIGGIIREAIKSL